MAELSWDCEPGKCRKVDHGDYITSAITREDLKQLKSIFRCKCKNAAKVLDRFGRNALHMAVSCGRYDVVEWLIKECSAEIHVKDYESGWNALHRSLFYGNIDSAMLLLKNGLDTNTQDKDGATALKLVFLDAQRSKMFKSEKFKLGRVILPYDAMETGEISLQIDQLIDIFKEYKSTGWGYGRLNDTKEKGKFPLNFVTILGDKDSNFSDEELTQDGHQSDVYVWGNNANFTLGQADTKNRELPELVETLHSQKCSIVQIAVSKYHTTFLCDDGTVFSCGQGRGGRLGHGNEQTILSPKKISSFNGIFCTAISSANDHTLILDQMGQVYSFGLNTYHQLGHHPVPSHCLVPRMIHNKQLKGKMMFGIAAARFHSAIYTKQEIFTFGLNAGQLGHPIGDDFQSMPKLVSSLYKKDTNIEFVYVSDGATCCAMNNGDIYLLQEYAYRRISSKIVNMKKLVMSGGELKCKILADLQHKDPDELKIALLKADGTVLFWRQRYQSFKECHWAGKRKDLWKVVDISLGKHLLIATNEGAVFHGHFRHSKAPSRHQKPASQVLEIRQGSNAISSRTSLEALYNKMKGCQEECEEVMIERVSLLYRAYRVACDVKSKIFGVVQNDPWLGVTTDINITEGTLSSDLETLLKETDAYDNIHDVIIKVKGGKLAAHRFILLSQIGQNLQCQLQYDVTSNKYLLDLQKHDIDITKKWLRDIYGGNIRQMLDSCIVHQCDKNKNEKTNEDLENDFVALTIQSFSLRDIESPDHHGSRIFCGADGNVYKNFPRSKKSTKKKTMQNTVENSLKREVVGKGFKFWKQMEDSSDIEIEAEDGSKFHCHKCILVARLEYFKAMLTSPWMESRGSDESVKIPMPSSILQIIIDFAYTDEALRLRECSHIELLCDVIMFADQWLITRLKEICETSLVKQVSLRNVLELLTFACTYNAQLLLFTCCEFVCSNLAYYLEARYLESLPVDVLSELSKVYKQFIPNMAYRVMTPSTFHIEAAEAADEQSIHEAMGLPFETEAEAFCSSLKPENSLREKAENVSKKRRRRHKSSATREVNFREGKERGAEENVAMQADLTQGDCMNRNFEDNFEFNEGDSEEVLEREKQLSEAKLSKFAPSSGANPASSVEIKSLRQIMEEEEKLLLNGTKRGPDFPVMKRDSPRKKSQKQRKEEMKPFQKGSSRDNGDESIETEAARKGCPWAKSEVMPIASLKDVINEEKNASGRFPSVYSAQRKVVNGSRRKLSWKELNSTSEPSNSASNEGAWCTKHIATSPPSSAVRLSEIIRSQAEEKETSNKILKKPLQLIQIEEKAIMDLLLHYNAKDNPTEYITVKRINYATSSPTWNVSSHAS